ncbi:MAG: HAD family hydrolase, partial [Deltaproteobacteria bacterium]|nr:HAD family hydrolase [Deltaproteobacteria bacterium]
MQPEGVVSGAATGPAQVAGVLFDLDGTLYAPPRLFKLRVALACGGDLGMLRHLSSVRHELAGRSFASEAALWDEHHALLARRCGATVERARRFYDQGFMPAFVEVLRRHARPRPGLVELVRELAARGVVCCVLSDHGRVEQRLQALGLDAGLFHGCASSAASGALKPAARPFLQMAQRFQVPPARWLVVGDRADTDGAGAAAAGMAFVGLGEPRAGRTG